MNVTTRVASCVVVLSLAVTGGPGLAGSGKAALTEADASCGDPTSSDIYFDCGNGTVTDNRTGLIWLKNPGCLTSGPPPQGGEPDPSFAKLSWDRATIEAHNLSHGVCGLTDNSKPGDWRMATLEEWQDMVADAKIGMCNPVLTNAAGDKCHSADPIFVNLCGFGDNGDNYWSATSDTGGMLNTNAFVLDLWDGAVSSRVKTQFHCLWPVRLTQGLGG